MAKKRYYDDNDSGMIKADNSAIANLPQNVKYVQYPETPYWREPGLNDSLSGVDRQIADDVHAKALKKSAYPEKY
jgi:hypothetical protein